jgi:hypothetical protein
MTMEIEEKGIRFSYGGQGYLLSINEIFELRDFIFKANGIKEFLIRLHTQKENDAYYVYFIHAVIYFDSDGLSTFSEEFYLIVKKVMDDFEIIDYKFIT